MHNHVIMEKSIFRWYDSLLVNLQKSRWPEPADLYPDLVHTAQLLDVQYLHNQMPNIS